MEDVRVMVPGLCARRVLLLLLLWIARMDAAFYMP